MDLSQLDGVGESNEKEGVEAGIDTTENSREVLHAIADLVPLLMDKEEDHDEVDIECYHILDRRYVRI